MERPRIPKDILPYVEYLESELKKFTDSPLVESYLSLLFQLNSWNQQLSGTPIDLFGDKEDKSFDRSHKYFTEQRPYFEQLDYLRKMMSPKQVEELEEKVNEGRVKKARLGTAEKIAMNGTN